jgi:beta-glucosidase
MYLRSRLPGILSFRVIRLMALGGAAVAAIQAAESEAAAETMPYRDRKLPVEQRVADLLSRMSAEEKAWQLVDGFPLSGKVEETPLAAGLARSYPHFIQKTKRLTPEQAAQALNEVQRRTVEGTRWGIPILFHEESLHGACWGDTTVFPQSIGLGATWDEGLVGQVAGAIAKEMRAVGVRQTLAPVINLARDPRWGRTEETYGEDPWLTSRIGLAYVRAMELGGVVATPKHFVANHGEGGRDSGEIHLSERYLREADLLPFEVAIREGGARSIMAAYNSIDGVPCALNPWLLTTVLRQEWGFSGIVVGDYDAVEMAGTKHGLTGVDLVPAYLQAGLEVDLPRSGAIVKAVAMGTAPARLLDQSVARLLRLKFDLGLFDQPYADQTVANQAVAIPEHQALALQAARESIVLLQNRGDILPLARSDPRRLYVIGPDRLPLGGYVGTMGNQWEGPMQRLSEALVGAHPGSGVTAIEDYSQVSTIPAEGSLALLVATIREGEGTDRSQLGLPAAQEAAILELARRKIPVVVLLTTGAPVTMEAWLGQAAAVLQVWYPGQQGSRAIAEVLFGDYNPGGRLPITFPKHLGQVPIYYSMRPNGRNPNNYADDDGQPRFPFGFGLSYTRFSYGAAAVARPAVRTGDVVKVSVEVRNVGGRAGDEVVQLYTHHQPRGLSALSSELRGFQRIHLAPGEARTVTFELGEKELRTWNASLQRVVEPGVVDLLIGRSSSDIAARCKVELRE